MPEADNGSLDAGAYVYAVVPASRIPELDLRGIDDTVVEFVEHGEIAAAVGMIALDRPRGRRHDLLAHSRVVEELARLSVAVPVQFGSIMADATAVEQELLASSYEHFAALLDQLDGTMQFNVRATYVEEQVLGEVVRDHPDIAELHRRTRDLPEGAVHPDLVRLGEAVAHAMEHKRAEDADDVYATVQPLAVAVKDRPGAGVDHVVSLAVLVEDTRREEFEDALEVLAEAVHERIRLALTGPLPAYDFVEDPSWA